MRSDATQQGLKRKALRLKFADLTSRPFQEGDVRIPGRNRLHFDRLLNRQAYRFMILDFPPSGHLRVSKKLRRVETPAFLEVALEPFSD